MINKIVDDCASAVSEVANGSRILVGGFGMAGEPTELLEALVNQGASELTIVANNAGSGDKGIASLIREGRVKKIICSFPRSSNSKWFDYAYRNNSIDVEVIPQGTLAERIRAAGAGIGGFYVRTATGTELAVGKEKRKFDGQEFILERPLSADYALIKGRQGDRWGNLQYNKSARNFGPIMATAAHKTIAQVGKVVELGGICPENVVTPGIYVDCLVNVGIKSPCG